MSAPQQLWDVLLALNHEVDGLIDHVRRAVEHAPAIGREIPWFASIEARFDNLPTTYAAVPSPNSNGLTGNNVVLSHYTNKSSRVYVRELAFAAYFVRVNVAPSALSVMTLDVRRANEVSKFPLNWRWNFKTSISEKFYSDTRMLARSGGRQRSGCHLSFRDPLIIEPMETFTFECEYLGGLGMVPDANAALGTSVVIAMQLSGYREGI